MSPSPALHTAPAVETALEDVYDDIAGAVGTTTEPREVRAGVAGLALLAGVGAAAAAVAWSPRAL